MEAILCKSQIFEVGDKCDMWDTTMLPLVTKATARYMTGAHVHGRDEIKNKKQTLYQYLHYFYI